ncbi:endonuclease/exonuclease/phosphatase family protein [Allokutzneria albata]|uniref:Metal-dependent hydrolase, endonuclease/exonuclease/phosphatase family n=1 Tax=Allokutzneria albata TaxID=211114 RepID=A0A1G9U7P5_ALLAB|nr:endonuclease/exonuclease/phosphatase family protein [Allokutzneria albata]SDM55961.1 Metal-dependent hydrolase, endonuclease/exonuclease/phosphatase family [Allokutzneria albata]
MRVITQNLLGHHQDWPRRRPVLIDGLRALRPDVLLLQEAVVTDDHDMVVDLLGDEFHVVHHRLREPDGSGISLASRWPIGQVRELDLQVGPRTADFAASAQIADIHWPHSAVPLLLVNHKPSYKTNLEHERQRQAVMTAAAVEEIVERTGRHVVLGGDFDAEPEAASVRFWRGLQSCEGTSVAYRDVWELTNGALPDPTFAPSVVPLITPQRQTDLDRRIDYLLIRCGDGGGPTLRATRCERTFTSPVGDVWASDHFGLVADLEVPGDVPLRAESGSDDAGPARE